MPEPISEPAWPVGAATGVGSMPGTDVRESFRVVLGELPDLPHLPELPGRGAGADLVGRTLALLPGFEAATVPSGWRVARGRSADLRRAVSWLAEDLDAVEELAAGFSGPFKVQLAGPLTLAASVELAAGERMLRDHGARRDLAEASAEAVRAHVLEVSRRLPGARVVVQLDEPGLPAVLSGRVPTASGRQRLRSVGVAEARELLRTVLGAATDAGATTAVHCCAAGVPVRLLGEAGADAVSLDAARLSRADDESLGEAVESGKQLLLGVVATDPAAAASARPGPGEKSAEAATVRPVTELWHRLGLAPETMAVSVTPTPACGLAGLDPVGARHALARARAAASMLLDPPEVRS